MRNKKQNAAIAAISLLATGVLIADRPINRHYDRLCEEAIAHYNEERTAVVGRAQAIIEMTEDERFERCEKD